MKIVKDINKLIMREVLEIVFLLVFVFFVTSLWSSSDKNYLSTVVSSMQNLSYTNLKIENPIQYEMFPMQNQVALQNLKPCILTVLNDTYTEESYMLVLKVSKSSTMDYRVLNVSVDGVVYPLTLLPFVEELDNFYFVLDENTLKGAQKQYKVQLWMDASTGNEMQAKSLIMNFELMNVVTKM